MPGTPRAPGRCPSPSAGGGAARWVPRPEPENRCGELGPRLSAGMRVEQPLPSLLTSDCLSLPLPPICGEPWPARGPFPTRASLGAFAELEKCARGASLSEFCAPFPRGSVWSGGARWHTGEQAFSRNIRVAGVLSCMPQAPGSEVPRGGEAGTGNLHSTQWPAGF